MQDYVTGPAEPPVSRVRNQFIYEFLLKLPKDAQFIKQVKKDILQQVAVIQTNKRYRSTTIVADVDAM